MTKLFLVAALATVGLCGPAMACEQHGGHAMLTTSSVTPVEKPAALDAVEPVALQSVPLAPETEASVSPAAALATGYAGCRGKKAEQTVILTD